MITLHPVTLERDGVRLEPLTQDHAAGIAEAVKDGELWKLWFTQIPDPGSVPAYIDKALEEQRRGTMLVRPAREGQAGGIDGTAGDGGLCHRVAEPAMAADDADRHLDGHRGPPP